MTSVLLPPRPIPYASQSSSGGILRNPSPYHRASTLPQPSYPSRSNQYLSSSTSSSEDVNTPSSINATPPISISPSNTASLPYTSDEDRVLHPRSGSAPEYGTTGSRRIRFAPLPDPRRAVLVTEHGEELPLPSVFDDDDPSGVPRPNLRNFHNSQPSSLLLGDNVVTTKEVPTITSNLSAPRPQAVRPSVPSPSSVHPSVTESSTASSATITSPAVCSSSSSARLAKRLLYPFRIKTDGFRRPGSRDSSSSRDDSPPSRSIPLTLWASADEGSRTTSTNGGPLSRVRSATGAAQSKPKRMLNGRVYGARKHHRANFFDNIPDDEPKFVEWGYGGMGSVHAGGMWSKVQSDRKFFDGHADERGRRGASHSADDEDDGSGMGWVKKRREERERKKREEQSAQEAASKTDAKSELTAVSASVTDAVTAHTSDPVSVDHNITTVTPALPRPEDEDESSDESDEEVEDESSSTEQEDDEADQEQNFKQVLGAGVERVSRHRD